MLYPFRIENEYFLFKTWNLFVIICSLPSILLALLLTKMPESPKFLLAQGNHDKTIDCLKTMYRWNNKSDDKFPVSNLTFLIHVCKAYNLNRTIFIVKFKISKKNSSRPVNLIDGSTSQIRRKFAH